MSLRMGRKSNQQSVSNRIMLCNESAIAFNLDTLAGVKSRAPYPRLNPFALEPPGACIRSSQRSDIIQCQSPPSPIMPTGPLYGSPAKHKSLRLGRHSRSQASNVHQST